MEEVTQDAATLNLMMHIEVDKRIALALHRMLTPAVGHWREAEIASAYDAQNLGQIQSLMRSLLIEAIMSDGSLMHQIRSKLAEQLNKPY
jgi:hypothetical protein